MTKRITDNFFIEDSVSNHKHPQTLWAKTKISFGYGLHKNEFGVSELNETIFESENIVPIGGVQYAMEQIFGVVGPIAIPTLNTSKNIGAIGSTLTASNGLPYPYGQSVCLFGIGTGGAAENNITALEDKYNEYEIPDMVPLRYTNDTLTATDQTKYFGKKSVNGTTAYYLKRFDSDPRIVHLYKDGEDGEDGSEVDASVFTTTNATGIESFTECCLTITKKDVREWFTANGNIEEVRFNSVGLFSAVYDATLDDYANIQLFSKLNIPTEPLSLSKDLNIIYRVYGA